MLTLEDYPKRAGMKRTEIPADVWKTGEPLGARRHHASRRTMGVGAWFLPRCSAAPTWHGSTRCSKEARDPKIPRPRDSNRVDNQGSPVDATPADTLDVL